MHEYIVVLHGQCQIVYGYSSCTVLYSYIPHIVTTLSFCIKLPQIAAVHRFSSRLFVMLIKWKQTTSYRIAIP